MKTTISRARARVLALACTVSLATAGSAWAATDTGNLTVTASIAHQCAVGNATLPIGAISLVDADGTIGATLAGGGTAAVPWACTNGTTASLSFGPGANASGGARRMLLTTAAADNNHVEYVLKAGSSAGAEIGTDGVSLTGDGTSRTYTVWGGPANTAANKAARQGSYSDTVLMTITFTP